MVYFSSLVVISLRIFFPLARGLGILGLEGSFFFPFLFAKLLGLRTSIFLLFYAFILVDSLKTFFYNVLFQALIIVIQFCTG